MAKNYFLLVDTETTQDNLVADFGAIICDKKGVIVSQCGVMVNGIFTNPEDHPLFFDSSAPSNALWSKRSADKRYSRYQSMIMQGSRMVASVEAINRWLARALSTYNPILTAYNLQFDKNKAENTGIDLAMFPREFCLWYAAYSVFAHSKAYRNFVLQQHGFNSPTEKGNMTYKTNAEIMARFVTGNPGLPDEPHTALEDVIDYELLILKAVLKKWSVKKLLNDVRPYSWNDCQVRDWFKA